METGKRYLLKACAIVVLVANGAFPSFADQSPCGACRMAGDAELAEMRGGYVAGDGLEITFGIQKSVLVNGILQAVNTLNIPLSGSSGDALSANSQGALLQLVQSGAGNTVAPSVLSGLQSGAYTIVQNTLDMTAIKNVTQINASVTVQNLYRNMNLNSMLNQQMINAVR